MQSYYFYLFQSQSKKTDSTFINDVQIFFLLLRVHFSDQFSKKKPVFTKCLVFSVIFYKNINHSAFNNLYIRSQRQPGIIPTTRIHLKCMTFLGRPSACSFKLLFSDFQCRIYYNPSQLIYFDFFSFPVMSVCRYVFVLLK